jgi:putative FmdB family regulatory protein
MPIYEYRCTACGFMFEKLMKSGGDADVRCPVCESAEVERRLSTFAAPSTSQPGGGCAPGGG